MVITYYGVSCFKVQSGEAVVVFNPPSKESEFKSPRFASDIVLISSHDKDFNGWENIPGKSEGILPFIVDGPGEYEVKATSINGIQNNSNTIYNLFLEDVSLCHLGVFDEKRNTPEISEKIGEIDILLVPVYDGQIAAQIATELEPKIIIPMNYKESELKKFLKELGSNGIKPVDKLTIKKKDLSGERTEAVVLLPAI